MGILAPRVVLVCLLLSACQGNGCSLFDEIPGGFPNNAKVARTVEARITANGFQQVTRLAGRLIDKLLPTGAVFDVPGQCGEENVCCGVQAGYCQIELNLKEYSYALPRIEVEALNATGARLGVTLRTRVRNPRYFPISKRGPLGGWIECWLGVNSAWSGSADLNIYVVLDLSTNAAGAFNIKVVSSQVWGLSAGDISISGEWLCGLADEAEVAAQLMASFQQQIPAAFAKLPMDFGIEGRVNVTDLAGELLRAFPKKSLDLFATPGKGRTNGGALNLDLTSGLLPGSPPSTHHCVPEVAAPPYGALAASALTSSKHPDTGKPFDIGVAIPRGVLDYLSWVVTQAGLACIDVKTAQVPLLSSAALSIFMPSLTDLTQGEDAPLQLAIRPQQPATFELGANTFLETPGGETVIDDPLFEINANDLEIDFSVWTGLRYVRFLTLAVDAKLAVGLDIDGEGRLVPVLGDVGDAVSNFRVKNSELLAEAPAELAAVFPAILGVALPGLGDKLSGGFEIPAIAGVKLELPERGVTSLQGGSVLGLFLNLQVDKQAVAAPIETRAQLLDTDPTAGSIELGLNAIGAETNGRYEWQFRIDNGAWSPFTKSRKLSVQREGLKLPGKHTIQVRSRQIGVPASLDPEPAQIDWLAGPPAAKAALQRRGTVATAEAGGCQSVGGGSGLALMLVALVFLSLRRPVRGMAILFFLCCGFGCGNQKHGSNQEGPAPDPTVQPGRWASIASEDDRAVAVAYESRFGDLVYSEITRVGQMPFGYVIDGAPAGSTGAAPRVYRNGSLDPGLDVGAWTSATLSGGKVMAAYQDRERGAVKLAVEIGRNDFASHDVFAPEVGTAGLFTSLSVSPNGVPGIAYQARDEQVAGEPATVASRLVFARALNDHPETSSDWSLEVIDEATADVPVVAELPVGTGLFASAHHYSDETPVVAFYDQAGKALRIAIRESAGWTTKTVPADGHDIGQWASVAVDKDDLLHLSYLDASTGALTYRTFARDGSFSAAEVVDDGLRDGDRPHAVGASAALVVYGGGVGIAYQDATSADVLFARRDGGTWQRRPLFEGPAGYGLAISAAPHKKGAYISTFVYDSTVYPQGRTEIAFVE